MEPQRPSVSTHETLESGKYLRDKSVNLDIFWNLYSYAAKDKGRLPIIFLFHNFHPDQMKPVSKPIHSPILVVNNISAPNPSRILDGKEWKAADNEFDYQWKQW